MGNGLADAHVQQTGNGEGNEVLRHEDHQAEEQVCLVLQAQLPGRPLDAPRQRIRAAVHRQRGVVVRREAQPFARFVVDGHQVVVEGAVDVLSRHHPRGVGEEGGNSGGGDPQHQHRGEDCFEVGVTVSRATTASASITSSTDGDASGNGE